MKCQFLFPGKKKKNVINLSSADFAHRVVKINLVFQLFCMRLYKYLTFTTLWAFSADDRLMIFFLFFPENRI